MASDLVDLIKFLGHSNEQIRRTAVNHLVSYSTSELPIWKQDQLKSIHDLKLLIGEDINLAKSATTILINLSQDAEIREELASDDQIRSTLVSRITRNQNPNADLMCMLMANIAKSDRILSLVTTTVQVQSDISRSNIPIDQLLDCFVKGADGSYNKDANYDYLSYTFADLSRLSEGRRHMLTARKNDDGIVPLTKLIVFTEHKSTIRRRGVANTIKNCAFDVDAHPTMLAAQGTGGIDLLPYILLPLMGNEDYSDEDTEGMLDEVQLLPPDKEREKENDIIETHLETLLLLTTTREGRERLRAIKVYPIIRELHLKIENEGVREGCDRLVQVLMRDEEGEDTSSTSRVEEVDEDEQIVEVL